MKALTKHFPIEEIPVMALQAGATMLLYCNEPLSPVKAVKSIARALSDGLIDQDVIRENCKIITSIKEKKFKNPIEPFSLEKAKQLVGKQEHKDFAKAVAEQKVDAYLNKSESQ